MYTNILIPLDGTRLAEAALPYARAIASRTGATLTLIRAAGHSSLFGEAPAEQQGWVLAAEDYLNLLTGELGSAGFKVETGVPFGGHPSEWIVEESEVRHADLIVMASHARTGVDRWVHGSVAEGVIHQAKCPVLLVKGSRSGALANRFSSDGPVFVVPLDQSELAEAALPLAIQMAAALGGRIVLISSVTFKGPLAVGYPETLVRYTDAEYAQMEAEPREYLGKITARIKDQGIPVESVVRTGDAALEIVTVAQQYAAAAVIMVTHGPTGIVRTMVGSVAGAVVHDGTTPVLLIRPEHNQPAFATVKIQEAQSYATS